MLLGNTNPWLPFTGEKENKLPEQMLSETDEIILVGRIRTVREKGLPVHPPPEGVTR